MPASPPFRAYTAQHLIPVGIVAAACAVAFRIGRSRPSTLKRLRVAAAMVLIAFLAFTYYSWFRLGFAPGSDLPLWLCDWVYLLAIFNLSWPTQVGVEVAYFWAMAGTLQALVTPDLSQGFPTLLYFLFFIGHGLIMAAVFLEVGAAESAPRPVGVLYAWVALVGYTAVVMGLDKLFGWDYGFMLYKPHVHTLLDYLGPWPYYILSGLTVGLVLFWLAYLPWVPLRRAHRASDSAEPRQGAR